MAILFQQDEKIFTLQTKQTAYQMKIDDFGYLLHLYYGGKISGSMDYLLTYYDRGFSGNPYDAGVLGGDSIVFSSCLDSLLSKEENAIIKFWLLPN